MGTGKGNEIIIAVIGLIGIVFTGLFSNWDKLFPDPQKLEATFVGYRATNDIEVEWLHLMNLTGTRQVVSESFPQFFGAMLNAEGRKWDEDPALNAAFEEAFQEASAEMYDAMIRAMLPTVKKHFDIDHLQRLNKFYSTPEMRAYVKKIPLIQQAMTPAIVEISGAFETRLRDRFQEIRDNWE